MARKRFSTLWVEENTMAFRKNGSIGYEMKTDDSKENNGKRMDRIEGQKIYLNGQGEFPKEICIMLEDGEVLQYRLTKTRNNKFLLN